MNQPTTAADWGWAPEGGRGLMDGWECRVRIRISRGRNNKLAARARGLHDPSFLNDPKIANSNLFAMA
eukprot:scaffold8159_cov109-Isochrysis_galbana.AAC.1